MKHKITMIQLGEHTSSNCEHCGREIKNRYTILFTDGENKYEMVVGESCAKTLMGEKFSDSPLQARRKKAEAEWKKQTPKPRSGETKDQYITRRITEKGNAYTAWLKWRKFNARGQAIKATAALGLEIEDDEYGATINTEFWKLVKKFEIETESNYHDFWNVDARSITKV